MNNILHWSWYYTGFLVPLVGALWTVFPTDKGLHGKNKNPALFFPWARRLTHVCPESPEALVGHVKNKRGRANGGEEFGLSHTFYSSGWGRGRGLQKNMVGLWLTVPLPCHLSDT